MKAVVLGGVAWNLMIEMESFPRPVAGTVRARSGHEAIGSSGAGKALNLAAAGWDVTLWAAVGDDEAGCRVRSRLAEAGVEFLGHRDPAGTMRHVNLMDADGDRISIFVNEGSQELDVDHRSLGHRIEAADFVAVTIFDHCRGFLTVAAERSTPVWIDIHDYDGENPHHRDFIEHATWLQASSVALPAWECFAERQIERGKELVLVTHGAGGASVVTSAGWSHIRPERVEPVDTNGAGDAFTAGFVTSWWSDREPEAALAQGAATAARALMSTDPAPEGRYPGGSRTSTV
jgi:sugar/nucleoside kinase (ribokinase family)